MTCDDAVLMIQARPEDLEAPEREPLDAHLAACPACRGRRQQALAVTRAIQGAGGRLAAVRPPRRLWPWVAAAAALLVAVSFRQVSSPTEPSSVPATRAVVAEPPKPLGGLWRAETGDLEGVVGRSALASLRRGSLLKVEGILLTLQAGTLHLDAPGEKLEVRVGDALLTLEDAEVTVEIPPRAVAWIAPAEAAEEGLRLTVWRGSVGILREGRREVVPAGDGKAKAWRGIGGWRDLEAFSLRNAARELLPSPPEGGYVLEALVRKRAPSAEMGLRIGGFEFPAGALLASSEGWTRLRVESRRGWQRVTVGSRELVSCPPERLGESGYRVEGQGIGLRAWGGDLEVRHARWRAE